MLIQKRYMFKYAEVLCLFFPIQLGVKELEGGLFYALCLVTLVPSIFVSEYVGVHLSISSGKGKESIRVI